MADFEHMSAHRLLRIPVRSLDCRVATYRNARTAANPNARAKIAWGLLRVGIAASLLLAGGLQSVQTATRVIWTGSPTSGRRHATSSSGCAADTGQAA